MSKGSKEPGQKKTANTPLIARPKYRVVQWATGNIGTRAMSAVIEHPDMELVGVWVHSNKKVGRDAGELCGLKPIGITATNNIDDIIALKPDCVLYMPEGCNFDEVCGLLASGANIITTRWDFNDPSLLDPAVRERVEEACRRGNSSIHGTGSSPGFITEAMPIVLLSLQRRLDCLTIQEFADLSSRNSPEMIFNWIGYGKAPGLFNQHMLDHAREIFVPSLSLIARAVSMPLDNFEVNGEFATARHQTKIAAGVIEAGKVAALRITVSGMRGGKPLMRMQTNWYCTTDLDPDWAPRETGWHVLLEGDTPLDINIRFPVPLEKWATVSPNLTAHRPVNAIPFVCAAAPGIRTSVDLPQIIARLG